MPRTDPNIGPTLGNQSQFIRLTTTAVSPAQRQPSNLKAAIEAPKKQELHPKKQKKKLQKKSEKPRNYNAKTKGTRADYNCPPTDRPGHNLISFPLTLWENYGGKSST